MTEDKDRVLNRLGEVKGWVAQGSVSQKDLDMLKKCLWAVAPQPVSQLRLELPTRIVAAGSRTFVQADIHDVPKEWTSVEYEWTFQHRHWKTDDRTTYVDTAGLPPGRHVLTVTARRGPEPKHVSTAAVRASSALPPTPPATQPSAAQTPMQAAQTTAPSPGGGPATAAGAPTTSQTTEPAASPPVPTPPAARAKAAPRPARTRTRKGATGSGST